MAGVPGSGLNWQGPAILSGTTIKKLTDAQFMARITSCKKCRRWIVPGRHESEWSYATPFGLIHKGGCPG